MSSAAQRFRRPQPWRLVGDQARYAVTEYWRARVVLVFSLFIPMTWLLVIGALAGNEVLDAVTGLRVMQFATPVAVSMGALYASLPTTAITLSQARESGVLKRLRGTPSPTWAYLAGRTLGASAFALASIGAMLAVGVLAYDVRLRWSTLTATAVTLALAVGCYVVLGLAVATLTSSATSAQAVSIGAVVVLSFVSGLFTGFAAPLPEPMTRLAELFPVKPVTDALEDQFNPFHTGSGWDVAALVVLLAWTAAAAGVAAWGLTPERSGLRLRPHAVRRHPIAASRGEPTDHRVLTEIGTAPGRPTAAAMVAHQAVAGLRLTWRDPGAVFFAVLMPVGLYWFLSTVPDSGSLPSGVPLSIHNAAGMITWGVGVTAFMNLPEAVVVARDRGVLKRLHGTPLTSWQYLAGRLIAALVVNAVIAALVLALGAAVYDLTLTSRGVLLSFAMIAMGSLALAAPGFLLAAAVPNGRALGAVALVILLPLAFLSNVFMTGGPAWMSTVGSFFPLKHLQHALVTSLDPAGGSLSSQALAVMVAWLVGAGAVAVRYFRWQPSATS